MVTDHKTILETLKTIPDPEMPISIVDLGLIDDVRIDRGDETTTITVDLLPTFIGCPALDMIKGDIEAKLGTLDDVGEIVVNEIHDPAWTVDRISDAGRASLKEHGVTVPERGGHLDVPGHAGAVEMRTSAVACPFCGSNSTTLDSPFGPTRCRMIFYCNACRNSFERMKAL